MTRQTVWTYALAGWSGFHVMLVEMLSSKLIAPFFGSGVHVWGSVIFVFMLGLAIGYLIGGMISGGAASVPRLAGLLALGAAVTIPIAFVQDPVLNGVFDHVMDPRAGALLCSLTLFLLPAICAGTISPFAVRILVSDVRGSGRNAGYLYFVSTVGSSIGTLATAFYLVLLADVNVLLLASSGVSLALAALAAVTSRNRA